MKIALIGYGKMGKMVEEAAKARGISVVAKIGPNENETAITKSSLKDVDVCIDFSNPSSAVENIQLIASLGKNIVMGTTGWYGHLDEVHQIIEKAGTGLVYSPNFSIGVALYLNIVSQAAALISPFDVYDVGGVEAHHNQKVDSPSGTAQAIVERLLSNFPQKKSAVYELGSKKLSKDQLHFSSLRLGEIPGTHTVVFDSPADTITLTHAARNRSGFAEGAVHAAEWIQGRQGIFTMDDLLLSISPLSEVKNCC